MQRAYERGLMIEGGKLTPQAIGILKTIFSLYREGQVYREEDESLFIEVKRASRLWYRCGMKLSTIDDVIGRTGSNVISFSDFVEIFEKIVSEDEQFYQKSLSTISSRPAVEVSRSCVCI